MDVLKEPFPLRYYIISYHWRFTGEPRPLCGRTTPNKLTKKFYRKLSNQISDEPKFRSIIKLNQSVMSHSVQDYKL